MGVQKPSAFTDSITTAPGIDSKDCGKLLTTADASIPPTFTFDPRVPSNFQPHKTLELVKNVISPEVDSKDCGKLLTTPDGSLPPTPTFDPRGPNDFQKKKNLELLKNVTSNLEMEGVICR